MSGLHLNRKGARADAVSYGAANMLSKLRTAISTALAGHPFRIIKWPIIRTIVAENINDCRSECSCHRSRWQVTTCYKWPIIIPIALARAVPCSDCALALQRIELLASEAKRSEKYRNGPRTINRSLFLTESAVPDSQSVDKF